MRTSSRRPIATSLVLVGAMLLLAGCGDEGQHLPASMSSSSAAVGGTTGIDILDDVIDGDPGSSQVGVSSMVEDPVLAGYDGIDSVGSLTDDPYSRAVSDWSETEGSMSGTDDAGMQDWGDEGLIPAGYGGSGRGYGDDFGFSSGYGYGGGVMSAAFSANGNGWGNAGLMDAGFDGGFQDPGLMDAGFEDPGFADPGLMDAGFEDPGFADAGLMDAGFEDPGFADAGLMDAGFEDPGFVDAGFSDPGFSAGAMDVGMMDVGAVDAGGFDTGIEVF